MNIEQTRRLAQQCGLGQLIAAPQAVEGGLLHRMWRLETNLGCYAVKELNLNIMARPSAIDNYRNSEKIARQAASQGLPAIPALVLGHADPLVKVDDLHFLIFEWVEGQALPDTVAPLAQARLIGQLLGRLHILKFEVDGLETAGWQAFSTHHWFELVAAQTHQNAIWADRFRATLPAILEWNAQYEAVGPVLRQTTVISHRDLDQKNVLWHDSTTPQIIDWEAAGLTNPALDLVGLALDWSGLRTGQPDRATFEAVIDSYRQFNPTIELPGQVALWGVVGGMLNWLSFNVERASGSSAISPAERALSHVQIAQTLTTLQTLTANIETWVGWL